MASNYSTLTGGYGLPARTSAGVSPEGVFVGPWICPQGTTAGSTGSFGSIVYTISATYGWIDNITFPAGGTVSYYQFCQDQQIASLTSVPNVSIENGTAYFENTLMFTSFGFGQELNNIVGALINGRWSAFVAANDGNWYYIGFTGPLNVSDGSLGIGKAMNDLNGFTLTMTSEEINGIYQLNPAGSTQFTSPTLVSNLVTAGVIQYASAHPSTPIG